MEFICGDYFLYPFPEQYFDGIITDIPYKGCINNKLGEENFSFEIFLEKTDSETKRNSFLITFCNFLCAADLIASAKSTNWKYHTHQVWDKHPVRTWISWGHPLRHTEYIVFFKKGDFKFDFRTGKVKPPYKRSSFGGLLKETSPNNRKIAYEMQEEVVEIPSPRNKIHPTEKPKEFSENFKKIIGGNKFVLDPFMGSGNLLSAFDHCIGMDLINYHQQEISRKITGEYSISVVR